MTTQGSDTKIRRTTQPKYALGQTLICTYADTQFYTIGKKYKVVKDEKDELGVIGNDGIFDSFKTVVSKFKSE